MDVIVGVAVLFFLGWIASQVRRFFSDRYAIANRLKKHFRGTDLLSLHVTERSFPPRIRADVHRSIPELFAPAEVIDFFGVGCESYHQIDFQSLISTGMMEAAKATSPQYEDIDVGEDEPIRCVQNGVWLLREDRLPIVVLLSAPAAAGPYLKLQIAVPPGVEGEAATRRIFQAIESAIERAPSYRGKIVSLEQESSYQGMTVGIRVHQLSTVDRDQVILPAKTVALLDRNVLGFVERRDELTELGMSSRKGLLFYGPPGTGKTHTIHYLIGALSGHTTLLITAEQIGLLGEYMVLARLLQPSIVIIEDADLIARERSEMQQACEEVLLNRLLNEMDGLKEDARVIFVLTTNRPEMLEPALSARPGRIDQAIEFPYPDAEGRAKLIELYAGDAVVSPEIREQLIDRTEGVSPAFIKELMRRTTQFCFEREGGRDFKASDVDQALEEMLVSGGTLNRRLLGAGE